MSRVFVGRLPYDTHERDLDDCFSRYGRIQEISLKRGYAFITFDDARDADDAVRDMNGRNFLGQPIAVEPSKSAGRSAAPSRRTEHRLVVENLASRTTWQDLKAIFRKAGDVQFADIDRRTGNGLLEFAHADDMEYALRRMDDIEIDGRRIRLIPERAGGGGGRGGGRGRSPRGDRGAPYYRGGGRGSPRRRSRSPRERSPRERSPRERSPRERSPRERSPRRDEGRAPEGAAAPASPPPAEDQGRNRSHSPAPADA